jgi:hypothetical protein
MLKANLDCVNPTLNKVWGLFLQAVVTSPPGVDRKNFEYSISQPLNNMNTPPLFSEVTTIIQSALSKTLCNSTLSPGTIATNIDMSVGQVAAYKSNTRYVPPQMRSQPEQPLKQKFSVKKVTFYQGKTQPKTLRE